LQSLAVDRLLVARGHQGVEINALVVCLVGRYVDDERELPGVPGMK
jgi:hypothetical protein